MTQRVFGLALGYEDLNDHDTLRRDALLAAVVGKADPTGASRVRAADRGSALAGKSTLNRLELAGPDAETDGYKKVQRQLFLPVAEDVIGRFVDPPRVV